jgi:hypothetical protein
MAITAYYAMGGGLGHLVRARAVLHTLGIEAGHVLTTSVYAQDPRVLGPMTAEVPPPECREHTETLAAWIERTLQRLAPDTLFVDAFPGGILGEISRRLWPGSTQLCYVGRLLRWQAYGSRLRAALPRFDTSYIVEPLHEDHALVIRASSDQVKELPLEDPPAASVPPLPENTWVVLHSGPLEEVRELVAYAHELQTSEGIAAPIQIVGPDLCLDSPSLPCFPAAGYFAHASRVITACGFNVMRQSVAARARHHFMPFARPLDDQYARAARRRRCP